MAAPIESGRSDAVLGKFSNRVHQQSANRARERLL